MRALAFPLATIQPEEDPTDRFVQRIVEAAHDIEEAVILPNCTISRCKQLHERIFTCLQILEAVDGTVRSRWDALLALGKDDY